MLLSHIKRLCVLLPSLISATPQNPRSSSSVQTALPSALVRAVPACAQPCLETSINDQFPLSCTTTINLSCLCSHYSIPDGFSLGEVALGCIYASCSDVDNSTAAAGYNVCLGQGDAVMPTHTALTVTAASSLISRPSDSTVTSTKHRSLTSASSHTGLAPSTRNSATPTGSVDIDSISTTTLATSTTPPASHPSAIATTSQAHSSPTMKPAQIAGLSVAAAATLIVAVGLMVLSICLRRRKEKRAIAEIISKEKEPLSPEPRKFSTRLSRQLFLRNSLPRRPSNEFKPKTRPVLKRTGPALTLASTLNNTSSSSNKRNNPNISIRTNRDNSNVRRRSPDIGSIHPALRPGAGYTNISNTSLSSVRTEQIGLAITAEMPGDSATANHIPQPPQKAELREQKVGTQKLLRPLEDPIRPVSVLTQDTVFEEDVPHERRRSSKLLPTPPVPIPPIRNFKPSKPAPTMNMGPFPTRPYPTRQQSSQQPELFLHIPARHSRSQPMQIEATQRPVLAPSVTLGPSGRSNRRSSGYDQYSSISVHTSGFKPKSHDIPSYYFMTPRDSPKDIRPTPSPARTGKTKDSPNVYNVKSKSSASTISRATSRASTNARDSRSSQTSFESVDSNDSTPEDEDEDKQLDGNKLSPVAESPISNLRYPKVPRASNQLVPRSPRSPTSAQSERSSHGLVEPSYLFMKRRGEQEALIIDSPRARGSPSKDALRSHMKPFRQHMRSTSMESTPNPTPASSDRHTRSQSGMWPKSPAMYESDFVRPLNVQSKHILQLPEVDVDALKSPIWVPRLTPRREGDDLLISVSYSSSGR